MGAVFPLTELAVAGVGVSYLNVAFSSSARWLFPTVLAVALIHAGRFLQPLKSPHALFLLAYIIWSSMTSARSIIPQFSLAKTSANAFVLLSMLAAGRYWAKAWTGHSPLYFLASVALTSAVAVFSGRYSSYLYQG